MKTKFLLALIAILFVAVLYLLFLNFQKPSTPVVVTQTPTTIPIPTIAPTADWNTYENKEYGFLFKYPNELRLFESDGQVTLKTNLQIEQPGGGPTFSLAIAKGDSVASYTKRLKVNIVEPVVNFNNIKFINIVFDNELDNYNELLLEIGDDLLILTNNPQIVSTFKLTTQTETPPIPSNWQKNQNILFRRGAFIEYSTKNGCFALSVSISVSSADLESFIKTTYQLHGEVPRYHQQYQYNNYQTITTPAFNAEEISHTFVKTKDTISEISLLVTKPVGPPECVLDEDEVAQLIQSIPISD